MVEATAVIRFGPRDAQASPRAAQAPLPCAARRRRGLSLLRLSLAQVAEPALRLALGDAVRRVHLQREHHELEDVLRRPELAAGRGVSLHCRAVGVHRRAELVTDRVADGLRRIPAVDDGAVDEGEVTRLARSIELKCAVRSAPPPTSPEAEIALPDGISSAVCAAITTPCSRGAQGLRLGSAPFVPPA